MKLNNITKLQLIYNTMTLVFLGFYFFFLIEKYSEIYILLILIPIFINNFLLTFFFDTKYVIVFDFEDNGMKYAMRFLPFYLIIYIIFLKKLMVYKTILLIASLILTKNVTIKDEYVRLISLIFYLYFIRNIFFYDFFFSMFFLYWYFFIDKFKEKIIRILPIELLVEILYIYMVFQLIIKEKIIGYLFNIIFFSSPFFFYYFFNFRICGIIFINIILTILLVARFFYVKVVVDPEFGFNITKGLALSKCEKYFTAVTTLINYEIFPIKALLLENSNNWIVYNVYEKYRGEVRKALLIDINKLEENPSKYNSKSRLEEALIRFYELAELPFDKEGFIENEFLLADYRSFNSVRFFEEFIVSETIKIGVLANNSLEVRTRNPIYFMGFFTERRFFLSK